MRTAGQVAIPVLFTLAWLLAAGCSGEAKKTAKGDGEPAPGGGAGRKPSSPSPSPSAGAGDRDDGPGESREAKREEAHVGGVTPPAGD